MIVLINILILIWFLFKIEICLKLKLIKVNKIKNGIKIILNIVIWFGIFILNFYF